MKKSSQAAGRCREFAGMLSEADGEEFRRCRGLHDVGTPPRMPGLSNLISTLRSLRRSLLPPAQKETRLQRASEGHEKPGTISSPALLFFH